MDMPSFFTVETRPDEIFWPEHELNAILSIYWIARDLNLELPGLTAHPAHLSFHRMRIHFLSFPATGGKTTHDLI
jgi:hypothetical protein